MSAHEFSALNDFLGHEIVLDLHSPYVCIGQLTGYDHRYLIVEQADVHDLRETTTTRERYILDTKLFGIRANRARTLINRNEIVSLALLRDIIE